MAEAKPKAIRARSRTPRMSVRHVASMAAISSAVAGAFGRRRANATADAAHGGFHRFRVGGRLVPGQAMGIADGGEAAGDGSSAASSLGLGGDEGGDGLRGCREGLDVAVGAPGGRAHH